MLSKIMNNNKFSINEFDKKKNKSHIIFICDHASNYIPHSFKKLGVSSNLLESHIAFDIGAKQFCLEICKRLKQSCFLSNFSRLIIDPNRDLNDNDLIVSNSWGNIIPGNFSLSIEEKNKRIKDFYKAYHSNLDKLVKRKIKKYVNVRLIAIHSFNKEINNFHRGVEVGLLYNSNLNILLKIQKKLQEKKIHFGRNYPYSGFFYNFTLDKHSKNGFLENISIEIRNDLICNEKGIKKYVMLFEDIFKVFIND